MKADILNNSYNDGLEALQLSNGAFELFSLILEDVNIGVQRREYIQDRRLLVKQLEEHRLVLSKARKLFVADKLQFDDFKELKMECQAICNSVGMELDNNASKLRLLEERVKTAGRGLADIFYNYLDLDVVDKKHVVSLIPPTITDVRSGTISLKINRAVSKILSAKIPLATFEITNSGSGSRNYRDRKVSVKRTISVLAKNNIQVDESEAGVILDFLYRMAKTYKSTNATNSK